MDKAQLQQSVRKIMALGKEGKLDDAYQEYAALFADPEFLVARPEDMRTVLRLLVHAKNPRGRPSDALLGAHRSAIPPLTDLVSRFDEPADYEMLGLCHMLLGNDDGASAVFKAGLAIERERNPQSALCGALMKWVAAV